MTFRLIIESPKDVDAHAKTAVVWKHDPRRPAVNILLGAWKSG